MEERAFDPLDYVSVLKRRKWWFILPLVLRLAGNHRDQCREEAVSSPESHCWPM